MSATPAPHEQWSSAVETIRSVSDKGYLGIHLAVAGGYRWVEIFAHDGDGRRHGDRIHLYANQIEAWGAMLRWLSASPEQLGVPRFGATWTKDLGTLQSSDGRFLIALSATGDESPTIATIAVTDIQSRTRPTAIAVSVDDLLRAMTALDAIVARVGGLTLSPTEVRAASDADAMRRRRRTTLIIFTIFALGMFGVCHAAKSALDSATPVAEASSSPAPPTSSAHTAPSIPIKGSAAPSRSQRPK